MDKEAYIAELMESGLDAETIAKIIERAEKDMAELFGDEEAEE